MNEKQRLDTTGLSGDGTFTINYDGSSTTLGYNDGLIDASTLSDHLTDDIFGSGNFTLTDNLNGTYDIELIGAFAETNISEMFVTDFDGSGSAPSFTTIQEGGAGGASRNTSHPSGYFYGYSP